VKKNLSGKIAIIGAGPAGLTAAGMLICEGLQVDVFDKLFEPGGLLMFAIPDRRIRKDKVRAGIEELTAAGVSFILRKKVGDSDNSDFLLDEIISKYDSVIIATGAWEPRKMNIEGENLEGVYHAAQYIVSYYSSIMGYSDSYSSLGSSTVIIGGGLTAVDSCLVAIEQKVKDVCLLYRRTKKEAPAGQKEIAFLESKGVNIIELKSPVRMVGLDNKLHSIVTVDIRLGSIDATGRPKPEPLEGSFSELEAESAIIAIGGLATPPFAQETHDIGVSNDRRILVDEKKRTSRKGVFAAGDVETGPSLIGPAIISGTEAALSIKKYIIDKQCK